MGFRLESLGHQAGIVLEFLGGSSIYLQLSTLAFRLQSSPRCGMVGVLIGAFSEGTGLQTNVSSCKEGAEDSLEHYCRCPVVLRVARHLFHISYPLELALNIWAINSAWLDRPHMIESLSLLMYGVYMAFNTLRYSRVTDTQQAFHCIIQHCKQGAFGHQECMNHLDSCWHRPVSHIC